jgi:tRNA U34 5-methylaminomethyl-2-thiouridine-forming methyltransferase MnmC
MQSRQLPYSILVIVCLVFAGALRAQDNPLNDPDLKQMLKEAEKIQKEAGELQKQNPTSPDTKKKLAEMEAQAKEEEARQEQEEKREKEKLQAALKKQLDAPGPVVLPDWTPTTPQFKAVDKPAKKIVADEVRIVQTGTSSLTPKELADGWEAAAVAAKNLNHGRNNISVNGKLTTIMFLSTRTDPVQEVKLEASREPGGKITQVEISSPLPKPNIESE